MIWPAESKNVPVISDNSSGARNSIRRTAPLPPRFPKPHAAKTFDVFVRARLAGNSPVDLAVDFDFDRQFRGGESPQALALPLGGR